MKQVRVHLHSNGTMSVYITYANKQYGEDRERYYPYIPKTAYKFIDTAKYRETKVYPDFISQIYSS